MHTPAEKIFPKLTFLIDFVLGRRYEFHAHYWGDAGVTRGAGVALGEFEEIYLNDPFYFLDSFCVRLDFLD
jgi:hypothetical protein